LPNKEDVERQICVRGSSLNRVLGLLLQSLATWETENKMHCRQTLLSGNGPKTYWSRELRGDELILVSRL